MTNTSTQRAALPERQIAFAADEFERRIAAVRDEMAKAGLDAILTTTVENVYYLTGYQTFGGAQQALLVTKDRQVLVLRHFESHLVPYTTYLDLARDVVTWEDSEEPDRAATGALLDLGLEGAAIGLDLRRRGLTVALRDAVAAIATVHDGTSVVESVRVIKTTPELDLMREAARWTDAGVRASIDAVRAGNTENDVAVAAYEAMVGAGSEYLANDPIITAGYRSGIPHTTFCRYRIQPGDAVLIELGANKHRYFAPLMRSAVPGKPTGRTQAFHDACVESLEAALAVVKPGITSDEAHAACQRVIDAHGFTDNFRKRLGYGIGIGWMSWSEGHIVSLRANDDTVLRPGMTIHMPPALREVPVVGVGCSESIVVTEDGCEVLSEIPRELFTT